MSGHELSKTVFRSLAGTCLVSLLALQLALLGGCESKQPAASSLEARDQSPQAKFDRILATLHDKLGVDPLAGEDGRYTSPTKAGTGTSVIRYTIDAPSEIKQPAPGQMPTATIKITQSSSYSFFPAKSTDDSADEKQEDKQSPTGPLGSAESELDAMGVEVLDPSMVDQDLANAFAPKLKPLEATARTISDDTHVVYQLVYEKDRWRLAGPPAVDSMQATNMAMEQALKRQR